MARRTRTIREMREMVEAAEARGLMGPQEKARKPEEATEARTSRPKNQPRMKVVWSVCDIGGRTVQQFDYPQKAQAEALVAQLIARGKGHHFVRSEKVPMSPES